jgi:uncharacterized iron-regulated membrane protein
MNLHSKLRMFHRKISPWFFPSLLLIALTGLIYRIGKAWFGMGKEGGNKAMYLHSGEWLGDNGSVIYMFVVGGILIFLVLSGLWMVFAGKSPKARVGKIHRVLAIIFSLPLLVSAKTGIAYQAGGQWFGADEGTLKLLMSLHQGTWLGNTWRPFYILLLGLGLIGLCLTGVRMLLRNKPGSEIR